MTENDTDRRVLRTRRRIRKSLFEMMRKIPYEKIRISQIADAADISRSTFYLHFETKDDLVASVLDEIIERYIHALDKPGDEQNVNPSYLLFSLWKENIEEMQMIVRAGLGYLIYKRLTVFNVEHEYLHNLQNAQLNKYVHAMINGASFALLLQWTIDGGNVPIHQMECLLNNLGTESLFEKVEKELPGFGTV